MKPKFALDRRTLFASIAICLFLCALVNSVGYALGWRYVSIPAALARAEDCEVRSHLLMEAMDEVGVCSAEDAAKVWAGGLKKRSAAMQYAVMDERLKAEFALQWETCAPNWVTGMSSPWIDSFYIDEIERSGDGSCIIRLIFSTATSSGQDAYYSATLMLARSGNFWRVVGIAADEGLYPYMGLCPR